MKYEGLQQWRSHIQGVHGQPCVFKAPQEPSLSNYQRWGLKLYCEDFLWWHGWDARFFNSNIQVWEFDT